MNDRTRLYIMLPVLGVAAWLAFFGDKSPAQKDAGVIAAVEPASAPTSQPVRVPGSASAPVAADGASVPQAQARANIKTTLKDPSPVNIFASTAPPPPPKPPVDEDAPPPPPPPPPFTVIGSVIKDGRFSVYLDKDNQTYIATPGAVLDGNRVDVVKSDEVQLFNLSTQKTQIIPVQGDK